MLYIGYAFRIALYLGYACCISFLVQPGWSKFSKVIKFEGRGFESHPGQSLSLSLRVPFALLGIALR